MTHFKGATQVARTALFGCLALAAIGPVMAQDTTLRTIAGNGNGTHAGDGGPAVDASINTSYDSVHDSRGNLLIADYGSHRIRRVDAITGIITTVAGTGTHGYNGDGIPATMADIRNPLGVTVDAQDNIYFTEYAGGRIRRVDATTGLITTIAGHGDASSDAGNGGPAAEASFQQIYGIAVNSAGDVFISSWQVGEIRRIDAVTGIIDRWVSTQRPWNIALDADENLYVTDQSSGTVMRFDAITAERTMLVGGRNSSSEDIPAIQARVDSTGVDVDAAGNVFIVETHGNRVRRIDAVTGLIRTIAGTGEAGFSGDGGPAIDAKFRSLYDVEVNADGSALVVPDSSNYRIRGYGSFGPATSADLAVTTTAADTQRYAGAFVGYGVDVENLGPDAAEFPGVGFAFNAEVPDMGVMAPTGWSCGTPTTGSGTSSTSCMAAALANGGIASFTVTGTAPASAAGRPLVLTAAATSQTTDPVAANNSDSDSTDVVASADLAVTLVGPATLGNPPLGIYTTSVRNLGALPANSPTVMVRAGVPSGNASMRTPAGWTCVRQPTRTFAALCQTVGSIAVGATVQFEATISSVGKVMPEFPVGAEAQSEVGDPDSRNNAAGLTVKVVGKR